MSYNFAQSLYELEKYDEAYREFLQAAAASDKTESEKTLTLGDVYGEYFAAFCLYRTGKIEEAAKLLWASKNGHIFKRPFQRSS